MIRYVVTTHEGAGGAYLARLGSWGNIPHTSIAAAEATAAHDAAGAPFNIERQRVKRRKEA